MRIDFTNKDIINSKEIYVHDAVFTGFNYNYKNKYIIFECEETYYRKKFYFKFLNVFGFKMRECDWWGESQRILDWEAVDINNNSLTRELIEFRSDENQSISRLTNPNIIIESVFTLISGDTFTIVCEYIDFYEEEIQ